MKLNPTWDISWEFFGFWNDFHSPINPWAYTFWGRKPKSPIFVYWNSNGASFKLPTTSQIKLGPKPKRGRTKNEMVWTRVCGVSGPIELGKNLGVRCKKTFENISSISKNNSEINGGRLYFSDFWTISYNRNIIRALARKEVGQKKDYQKRNNSKEHIFMQWNIDTSFGWARPHSSPQI